MRKCWFGDTISHLTLQVPKLLTELQSKQPPGAIFILYNVQNLVGNSHFIYFLMIVTIEPIKCIKYFTGDFNLLKMRVWYIEHSTWTWSNIFLFQCLSLPKLLLLPLLFLFLFLSLSHIHSYTHKTTKNSYIDGNVPKCKQ